MHYNKLKYFNNPTMESCILCLDINKELVDSIKVDSTQWQELQIKTLIDKHLWTMESLLPSSWLCSECWRTLFDFHKFYMRIEEAHMDFGLLVNTKIEAILKDEKEGIPRDEYKHPDESNDLFECPIEPDISVDPLVMEDHKLIIKEDPDEDKCEYNIPLMLPHKRRRNSKNTTVEKKENPLTKCKKTNSSKKKISKRQKKTNRPTQPTNENSEIKPPKIQSSLENYSDCDNSSTGFNSFPENMSTRSKRAIKIPKSQNKETVRSSDCEDSNTDSEYKPDDLNTDSDYKPEEDEEDKPHKQTSEELDQFLTENFKLTCVFCQISMATFKTLLKHCEKEHKERGYVVCCDKKFYQRIALVEHVYYHVDPSNFKCFECGKEMSSRKSLKSHQIVHLSEEQKKFSCSKCGKNFAAQSLLSNHMKAVHLKRYLKICDICGKALRCESFERHMLEHEGKPIPMVNCDICGLLLSNKRNLKRHIGMQHPVGGNQTHSCHLCPKISPNIRALREHINRVHIVANVHKCTMCGRGFKRKLALKEHMATHTGIALYTCPWCPKTFNANSSMHAHRKRQHRVEWEEAQKQKISAKYIIPPALEINNVDFQ